MGSPVVIKETVTSATVTKDIQYTYEELLDIFPDGDGSIVNPLVRRCQQYEVEIERLRDDLAEYKRLYNLRGKVCYGLA